MVPRVAGTPRQPVLAWSARRTAKALRAQPKAGTSHGIGHAMWEKTKRKQSMNCQGTGTSVEAGPSICLGKTGHSQVHFLTRTALICA